jgi:transcriptional regulator with XRE-family HTH domain
MIDKFARAIKDLRRTLDVTQIDLAERLGLGVPSIAHYEIAHRRPEAATTAVLCRAAHNAGRDDLAEIFAAAIPGVEDGLLVPCWRLPQELRPAPHDETRRQTEHKHKAQEQAAINKSRLYQARLEPDFKRPELCEDDIAALVEIARRQAALRVNLKAALEAHDNSRALAMVRALVGLQEIEQRPTRRRVAASNT